MLPRIGDIDVMFHFGTDLAIPRGHPPPTQLPAEFHDNVQVHEILDSHCPGYVYLELRYLLTQCDDDKYNAVEYVRNPCLSNRFYDDISMFGKPHGPAIIPLGEARLTTDVVYSVRHLVWPPQAAAWPTRHRKRNYGWPDSATVDRVVSNGCDVVPMAHRQCRQHEFISQFQWRLSFSRAEIVLMNSWIPV